MRKLQLAWTRKPPKYPSHVNSLAPGKFEWNFKYVIFKRILVIDGWRISCEIVLIWMSQDFTDDQSTLVQVMAWCRQATSHYMSQCWLRSLLPYGITRPQWLNSCYDESIFIFSVGWQSLTRYSWFEPISSHHGLGKPTARLISHGESNYLVLAP